LNSNARVVRTSRRARDDRRMGDALARLRARLPAANDQAMASALNARAARTATTLDALCASAEAKLGAAARALREAEARTALLERALEAGTATTTTTTAEAATREDDGRGADAADAADGGDGGGGGGDGGGGDGGGGDGGGGDGGGGDGGDAGDERARERSEVLHLLQDAEDGRARAGGAQ